MTAPVFGNCGQCGAWQHTTSPNFKRCLRRAPHPIHLLGRAEPYPLWPSTYVNDGCFDWLPKPLAMEKNDG